MNKNKSSKSNKDGFKFMKNDKNSCKGSQTIPKNNMRISRSGRGN